MTCPREYRAFLKALAKNYPAAAILNPSYAASDFVAVLQPGFVIGYAAARAMHENFPELHSLKQICLWESIPRSWLPFLEQLAERAAHIQNAPEVSLSPCKMPFLLCWQVLKHTVPCMCSCQISHCLLALRMLTASCQHIHCIEPYQSSGQTRRRATRQQEMSVPSIIAVIQASRLVLSPCSVPMQSAWGSN